MGFDKNIEGVERTLKSWDLSVLIWGPGKFREEENAKREKIRTVIKNHFPNADVYFSEDEELRKKVPHAKYLSLQEEELYHLASCDVCIVLDTSPGTAAEIAHFVSSIYAHRLFILTHKDNENTHGFPGELRKGLNLAFYDNDEWVKCNLTERALARTEAAALSKMSRK